MANKQKQAASALSVAFTLNATALVLAVIKSLSDRPEFDGQYQLPILIPSALIAGSVLHAGAVCATNSYDRPDLLAIAELGAGILYSLYSQSPGMYEESYWNFGLITMAMTGVKTLAIIANLLSAALHGAKAFQIYCKQDSEVVDQSNAKESARSLLRHPV